MILPTHTYPIFYLNEYHLPHSWYINYQLEGISGNHYLPHLCKVIKFYTDGKTNLFYRTRIVGQNTTMASLATDSIYRDSLSKNWKDDKRAL